MTYAVTPSSRDQDKQEILDLWRRNLPAASAARYIWLYETGPATSWLASTPEGVVVGATGLMRRTMQVGGRMLSAGQAIDLNVDRRHRTVGPAVKLQRALLDSLGQIGIPLVYGFPSKDAESVLRRVGYVQVGCVERWVKPLRSARSLEDRLKLALPRRTALLLIDFALKIMSAEAFYRRPRDLHFEITDSFDDSVDALWERASRQFQIIGERTSAYLNWRFCRCPDARYRVIRLSGAGGGLRAYAAYHVLDGVAYVGDLLFADEAGLEALLAEFLLHLRAQGAAAVVMVYFGSRILSRKLRRFGFWKRKTDWRLLVHVDRRELGALGGKVLDKQSWYLTRGDVDTDV